MTPTRALTQNRTRSDRERLPAEWVATSWRKRWQSRERPTFWMKRCSASPSATSRRSAISARSRPVNTLVSEPTAKTLRPSGRRAARPAAGRRARLAAVRDRRSGRADRHPVVDDDADDARDAGLQPAGGAERRRERSPRWRASRRAQRERGKIRAAMSTRSTTRRVWTTRRHRPRPVHIERDQQMPHALQDHPLRRPATTE
jgi:hypothetical protein